MDVWILLLFVGTELMFSLSPGPAVAAVVSASINGGYRLAFFSIMGVLVGNLMYFAVSAIIISTGTTISDDWFIYIKVAGCMYLAWMLVNEYLLPYLRPAPSIRTGTTPAHAVVRTGTNRFTMTLVMQLSNPKTILFFTAFLPQFIQPEQGLALQFSVLAALSFATEFVVLFAYAAGGQVLLKRGGERFGTFANHTGNLLMAIAVVWSVAR